MLPVRVQLHKGTHTQILDFLFGFMMPMAIIAYYIVLMWNKKLVPIALICFITWKLQLSLAGEYVGLTGARLDGAEMLTCGLATHFVQSEVESFLTPP